MERKSSDQKTRVPSGAAVQKVELTEALYRAFFREWAEHGFSALSLERVAARRSWESRDLSALAGKTAICRRGDHGPRAHPSHLRGQGLA
ncbi:hypothetical protein N8D56_09185 [Devosia sp. A8/3-2]|nr:hypothetical protein N8D56_09185 [Devosia sp. A8/3-2]